MLSYFIVQSFTVRLLKAPPFFHPLFPLFSPAHPPLPLFSPFLSGQPVSLSDPKSTQNIFFKVSVTLLCQVNCVPSESVLILLLPSLALCFQRQSPNLQAHFEQGVFREKSLFLSMLSSHCSVPSNTSPK